MTTNSSGAPHQELKPGVLSGGELTDALVYCVTFEPGRGRAVMTIEVDPKFHVELFQLLGWTEESELLLDFIFSGVASGNVDGVVNRPAEWEPDEKPHNSEIARFSIRRRALRRGLYELQLDSSLGQRYRIVFERLFVERSSRRPGVVHNYGDDIAKREPRAAGDGRRA